jgi:hypothetical protein
MQIYANVCMQIYANVCKSSTTMYAQDNKPVKRCIRMNNYVKHGCEYGRYLYTENRIQARFVLRDISKIYNNIMIACVTVDNSHIRTIARVICVNA